MIPRKEIARKKLPNREVEEPPPAFLKELRTSHEPTTWEIPEEGQSKRRHMHLGTGAGAGLAWTISDRFDRLLPPHRRYLGRSRRTFLIALLVVFVCLLALVIGLAVGLSNKSK